MAKYNIGGWDVSLETKMEHDRQMEKNRQQEYRDAELRRQTQLLEQIVKNTAKK